MIQNKEIITFPYSTPPPPGTVKQIFDGEHRIELNAQNSFIRRLQHKAAAKEGISSISIGEGSKRRVILEKVF